MKKLTMVITAMIVILTYISYARAEVPKTINFQGRITDANGNPLDETYDIDFLIYDVESGGEGEELWSEGHTDVDIAGGICDRTLGKIEPLNLAFDKQYYMEIKIEGEALTPRYPLVSAPYALCAKSLEGCAAGDFIKPDDRGFVGIGTDFPLTKLHVEGGNITVRSRGSCILDIDRATTSIGGFVYQAFRRNGEEKWWIRSDGNGDELTFSARAGAGHALTITQDGDVGIGTINPEEKLHVKGIVKAQAFDANDITFNDKETGERLWRMFEDEEGLYLESAITGKTYKLSMQEVDR